MSAPTQTDADWADLFPREACRQLQAKVEQLERENAALRHTEENLAATVRGLEFELEKAEKATAMLRGTVEALGDGNDRLTIEKTALRKGLDDAATSLCTISQQAGRTEELSEMSQIRGYAFSRYSAALDAARKEDTQP